MTGAPQSSSILREIQADAVGKVPSHWEIRSVGELVRSGVLDKIQDGNHGESHPVSKNYVPSGIPFLMSGSIRNGRVNIRECKFLTIEHAKSLRVGHAYRGDVLLTHKGNDLGRTAILRETDWAVLTPQITYYRVRDGRILLPEFLRHIFESPKFQHQFKRDSEQSTRPFVSISNQEKLFIPVPPAEEQQAVAHILGTLDDKIELNRGMNETLEAIAQALFKSWFVDFDPVHVLAGREPERPPYLTKSSLQKFGFPDRFEESELGEMPYGWTLSSIGCETRVVGGSTPSTSRREFWENGKINWATPKDLAGLNSPVLLDTERRITEAGLEQISSGLLPAGTVLLSSRAPIGYLAISEVPIAVNQGFIAMICNGNLLNSYVRLWCKFNQTLIEAQANGTTFLEISKANFRPLRLLVPPKPIMNAFHSWIEPISKRMVSNLRESKLLLSIRDRLLPKLLSGEIRVNKAEELLP